MKPPLFASHSPLHWISAAAIALAVLDTFFVSISLTALGLFFIASLPWIIHLFRSIELPGGIKLEMKDLERASEELADAGLLAEPRDKKPPASMQIGDKDPNLALAGLRIGIEKSLRDLARSADLDDQASIRRIMKQLSEKGIISQGQESTLADLLPALNRAVHGAEVPQDAYDWAMYIGPQILSSLELRRMQTHSKSQEGSGRE